VGSRLLNRLEERLGKSGVNSIYLGTNKGTPAEASYRKHGYKVSDEEIEMSPDLGSPERG
jgi:GNAT superfamily N-acetyltransferase